MRTLDLDECADFLGLHPTTAKKKAAAGELPGAKIGRSWVFLESDLVEYLQGQVRNQMKERQEKVLKESAPVLMPQFPVVQGKRGKPRRALPDLSKYDALIKAS
jgi:excisionase family DNA binding protein